MEFSAEYESPGQSAHVSAPARALKVPAIHAVHLVDPVLDVDPAVQGVHDADPSCAALVPAVHASQVSLPLSA